MKIENPGNVLPFYKNKRWQRHRHTGQNLTAWGLIAPNTVLIPWQLFIESGDVAEISLQIVNAASEVATNLDTASLEVKELATGPGFWVTWKAEERISPAIECGFYYLQLSAGGEDVYYSEVMHLIVEGSQDSAGLAFAQDGCSFDGILTLGLIAADSTSETPASQLVEFYANSQWNPVSPVSGVYTIEYNVGDEGQPLQVRRTIVTPQGQTITAAYSITWGVDVCDTITLGSPTITKSGGAAFEERWRIRFYKEADSNMVLYQTGYQQQFWCRHLVWDVPEIEENLEVVENGEGEEVLESGVITERLKFEVPDIPDFLLHELAALRTKTSVIIETVDGSNQYIASRVTFAARRQGPSFSTGIFSCVRRVEISAGCDNNYQLVE